MKKLKKYRKRTAIALTAATVLGTMPPAADLQAAVRFDHFKIKDIYEAENAVKAGDAKVNTDHRGYSGDGFVDGMGNVGSSLKFNVTAKKAGRHTLSVRYSAGNDGDAATINLYVNGTKQEQLGLAALGSWDKWWNRNCTVELKEGQNTIELKREDGNANAANVDYITIEEADFTYIGQCSSYQQNEANEVTFQCENAAVRVKACSDDIIKVWCEPTGKFYRRYDSFTVVNEEVKKGTELKVEDAGSCYKLSTGKLVVEVAKAQFALTYKDKAGNVLCENQAESIGWNDQNELIVRNKIASDEQFWGLGEKTEAFNRKGENLTVWSTDFLGRQADAMTAELGKGCWYLSDPHYISSKGYAIYFDNTSRTQFDLGASDAGTCSFGTMNPAAGGELCYYFIGGENMKEMTTSFTDLVGKSFFAPQWAYGNMQCHYGYTQERIQEVAKTYREKQIPCDVMFSDIEWYQNQCSPTEWNHKNFPDPEAMLSELDAAGFKFGVIDDPNVSAATTSTSDYKDGNAADHFIHNLNGETSLAFWPWGGADGKAESGHSGVMDFFKPEAAEWWGDKHNDVLAQGIDAFWLDMNEPARYLPDWAFYNENGKSYGNIEEMHNAYALKHNQAMYEKVSENKEKRPFLQTRSGFTGSHRYASPWTGDITSDWTSMEQQLRLGLGLSMSGFSYWGFDIGGFSGSFTNDQYKRWVELSTFTPVHRFHYANWNESGTNGDCYNGIGKEPWNFDCEEISKEQINMRYELIPYFYSCTADSVIGTGLEGTAGKGTGIPLARPMVMEYYQDPQTYDMDSQFMCGPSFLVAPVVSDTTKKEVYFPAGTWYDYSDGTIISAAGGETKEYDAPIDKLPVFVKAGAIIPKMPVMQYVGEKPLDKLTLDIYPLTSEGESSFVYYEDDGESQNYKDGMYATTKYTCSVAADQSLTFDIEARTGQYAGNVAERDYLMQFHHAANVSGVRLDQQVLESKTSLQELESAESGYFADSANQICYVKMKDDANRHTLIVETGGQSQAEAMQKMGGQEEVPEGMQELEGLERRSEELLNPEGTESQPKELLNPEGLESQPEELPNPEGLESQPEEPGNPEGTESQPEGTESQPEEPGNPEGTESQPEEPGNSADEMQEAGSGDSVQEDSGEEENPKDALREEDKL